VRRINRYNTVLNYFPDELAAFYGAKLGATGRPQRERQLRAGYRRSYLQYYVDFDNLEAHARVLLMETLSAGPAGSADNEQTVALLALRLASYPCQLPRSLPVAGPTRGCGGGSTRSPATGQAYPASQGRRRARGVGVEPNRADHRANGGRLHTATDVLSGRDRCEHLRQSR
jgi:hypothetical protein